MKIQVIEQSIFLDYCTKNVMVCVFVIISCLHFNQ